MMPFNRLEFFFKHLASIIYPDAAREDLARVFGSIETGSFVLDAVDGLKTE